VSGFFYTSHLGKAIVGETGGITSWQTLEPILAVSSDVFTERRITMPVPSAMFGPELNHVYEVWKFFQRRE
jgi:hypothetical protein